MHRSMSRIKPLSLKENALLVLTLITAPLCVGFELFDSSQMEMEVVIVIMMVSFRPCEVVMDMKSSSSPF